MFEYYFLSHWKQRITSADSRKTPVSRIPCQDYGQTWLPVWSIWARTGEGDVAIQGKDKKSWMCTEQIPAVMLCRPAVMQWQKAADIFTYPQDIESISGSLLH